MVEGLTRRGFLPAVSDSHRMAPAGCGLLPVAGGAARGGDVLLIALEAMACPGGGHLWFKA